MYPDNRKSKILKYSFGGFSIRLFSISYYFNKLCWVTKKDFQVHFKHNIYGDTTEKEEYAIFRKNSNDYIGELLMTVKY